MRLRRDSPDCRQQGRREPARYLLSLSSIKHAARAFASRIKPMRRLTLRAAECCGICIVLIILTWLRRAAIVLCACFQEAGESALIDQPGSRAPAEEQAAFQRAGKLDYE